MLATNPAKQQPRPVPAPVFTFTCNACETVQVRPDQQLPEHWTIETIGDAEYCFCGACSADLPGAAR